MSRILIAITITVLAVGILIFKLSDSQSSTDSAPGNSVPSEGITLFCAASNRMVIEEICRAYEREYDRQVNIQFGASQTLLSSIETAKTGDLYLPADDSYLVLAVEKKLVDEILPLAIMRPVVVVKKGNPKSIRTLSDLVRPDIRFVQASPEAAAIGKLTREYLVKQGQWQWLDKATTAYRMTVTDVANDVLVGAADAGIVYDAVLHTYPDLEALELPELQSLVSQVSLGVLSCTTQPTAALHFARYVAARDKGLQYYEKHGFGVVTGDAWSEQPELKLFAGSMLRPAIEDTILQFEKREGVRVSRVYNGCGILVAQMKAGQIPDAYFACDREFMNQVSDIFPQPTEVSQNQLVILVPKGNPKNIRSLKDLIKPDLRVGIGHEKQCAMGWITQNTFKESGIQKELMSNVTVQTPTGDMLVNQLQTGSLDAAVAYLSNAAGAAESLDAVPIQDIACSIAIQPWAVAQDSPHAQTAARLFAKICSVESQEVFEAEGFMWHLPAPIPKNH
ncbi:MAG: extracellular solute-binding protein [Planctomycetales bacterium]|nr:extracellular solute-binding protein [Planctomycetales bacterium]